VSIDKIQSYLDLHNVIAVGGTWIATPEMISAGDFSRIETNARLAAAFKKS
jgi:2-dehydro-3-deoxyphosphogluconate aldolase / (4S)-4-hydroxy-2-oxoglutarate aldolase